MYDVKLEELLHLDSVDIYSLEDRDLSIAGKLLTDIIEEDFNDEEVMDRINYTNDIINDELIARGLM